MSAEALARLSGAERAALREATAVLRERFPVRSLTLFGSKARGDDDAESDVDLLVLTERPLAEGERNEILDVLFDIGLVHDVILSALVVPAAEWWDGLYQALPIRREIDEHGILL